MTLSEQDKAAVESWLRHNYDVSLRQRVFDMSLETGISVSDILKFITEEITKAENQMKFADELSRQCLAILSIETISLRVKKEGIHDLYLSTASKAKNSGLTAKEAASVLYLGTGKVEEIVKDNDITEMIGELEKEIPDFIEGIYANNSQQVTL